ncbi:hypothetical protein [Rhodococcus sp. IEGM 1408]|uniref:hypothetical protein n=1 Tax=Rhodococcus sp. IEGM 1408 TaxID=3082220 RepID=UPI002955DA4E|nr:hypothetical protein [Rhodococcus sp. IEGM 1408]MDV8002473.1 hypothetical protein [Rhodococcus sp. IEGM 1408]
MKSPVKWALVGASVVLLGFTSLQVTDAAWSGSRSSPVDPVRTGHLRITGAGKMALDVSGLTKANLNTGDQVQIPLTVFNDSTIPVSYKLTGVAVLAGTTPPALNLRVARVASASACPTTGTLGTQGTQMYPGAVTGPTSDSITSAVTSATTLGVGATDVLCLTTTAPTVSPGKSGNYVFTFRADQQ